MKRNFFIMFLMAFLAIGALSATRVNAQTAVGCDICHPSLTISMFNYRCDLKGFSANTSLYNECESKGFSWDCDDPNANITQYGAFCLIDFSVNDTYEVCVEWHYGPDNTPGYCTLIVCKDDVVVNCQ